MIVVVASRFDAGAVGLVDRWRERGARLLTCEDLSRRGWIHDSCAPERSMAVFGGDVVPVGSIRGVVTRLVAATESELPHIVPSERAYVASEMTAFLFAWLSSLRCRVVNRPTPLNLTGPSWSREQWAREAMRAGLEAQRVRRVARAFAGESTEPGGAADDSRDGPVATVSLVGDRCFADTDGALAHDPALTAGVCRLARAAGVDLLTTTFVYAAGTPTFIGAAPWVAGARPEIADALLAQLAGP